MTPSTVAGDHYVGMGSSFAAGPGIKPREPGSVRAAGRSGNNYAHVLARTLALSLTDVSFSGATTSDLLTTSKAGHPPQLDAVTTSTKLVTMTCGGNDVGYLPGLTASSLPRAVSALPSIRRQATEALDPSLAEERFRQLEENLTKIVREARLRAPDATIVLIDYLTILPPDDTTSTTPLPQVIAAWGRGVASRLSTVIEGVATKGGAVFVSASEASASHHAWSDLPWTMRFHYSLRGGAPYHPNAAGMAALAELIRRKI